MAFRHDSPYVFLTYSQSGGLDHNELYEFVNAICPVLWARICTEEHSEEGKHNHALFKFTKRFTTRDCRKFDFANIHPKIEGLKSTVAKALAYVAKDGQFTDYGDIPTDTGKRTRDEALALAGDPDESTYLKACIEASISYQYAKRFRELAFSDNSNTIDTDYEPNADWEQPHLQSTTLPENSCAVLIGPTGIGKSAWAKRVAPKPALWVSHLDVLRLYRPTYHKSIIFDDMSFKHMPIQAQIHLVDWVDTRQIHCRYGYATIPAKTIKIFTCNSYPFTARQPDTNPEDYESIKAIERRITLL